MTSRTNVKIGDTVTLTVGYSEAAMATRIAGTVQNVLLIGRNCAVLVDDNGNQRSAPYLPSELSIMDDTQGFYYHKTEVLCA